MIVCSCAVIRDRDIETALIEIMSEDDALLPTPGVIFRHLSKKMNCCGCAQVTVQTIYQKMNELEAKGLICPCACASARSKLVRLDAWTRDVDRPGGVGQQLSGEFNDDDVPVAV